MTRDAYPKAAPHGNDVAFGGAQRSAGRTRLVIFDFDGVVVDSEPISLATLRDTLDHYGLPLTVPQVRARFLGNSIPRITAALREETGQLAEDFTERWFALLFARFRAELAAMPGIVGLLDHLDQAGLPYCIASGSSVPRLTLSLQITGLTARFGDHVFSADAVRRGKPAPDLFLHAARVMGVPAEDCLVVEDAPAGIEAAQAAGMRAVGYVGGSHLTGVAYEHAALLRARGADDILTRLDQITVML